MLLITVRIFESSRCQSLWRCISLLQKTAPQINSHRWIEIEQRSLPWSRATVSEPAPSSGAARCCIFYLVIRINSKNFYTLVNPDTISSSSLGCQFVEGLRLSTTGYRIWIMSSNFPYTARPSHIIEGKFVDQRKLMRLLRNVYGTSEEGKDNFRVELRLDHYKIYPSEHVSDTCTLTEDQIQHCRARKKRGDWNWKDKESGKHIADVRREGITHHSNGINSANTSTLKFNTSYQVFFLPKVTQTH